MAEHWFQLSNTDKADALETGASALGRPAHLVEKDIGLSGRCLRYTAHNWESLLPLKEVHLYRRSSG